MWPEMLASYRMKHMEHCERVSTTIPLVLCLQVECPGNLAAWLVLKACQTTWPYIAWLYIRVPPILSTCN